MGILDQKETSIIEKDHPEGVLIKRPNQLVWIKLFDGASCRIGSKQGTLHSLNRFKVLFSVPKMTLHSPKSKIATTLIGKYPKNSQSNTLGPFFGPRKVGRQVSIEHFYLTCQKMKRNALTFHLYGLVQSKFAYELKKCL